jgi:hypothetical protein
MRCCRGGSRWLPVSVRRLSWGGGAVRWAVTVIFTWAAMAVGGDLSVGWTIGKNRARGGVLGWMLARLDGSMVARSSAHECAQAVVQHREPSIVRTSDRRCRWRNTAPQVLGSAIGRLPRWRAPVQQRSWTTPCAGYALVAHSSSKFRKITPPPSWSDS